MSVFELTDKLLQTVTLTECCYITKGKQRERDLSVEVTLIFDLFEFDWSHELLLLNIVKFTVNPKMSETQDSKESMSFYV